MSAILKPDRLETIFDHAVTQAELAALYDGDFDETRETYEYGLSQNGADADLYLLYHLRGDDDKASHYLDRISDDHLRQQFIIHPCCSVSSSMSA